MGLNFVATKIALVHIHVLMLTHYFLDGPCMEMVQVGAVSHGLDGRLELNHVSPVQPVNFILEL